jgi:hypothetical protein
MNPWSIRLSLHTLYNLLLFADARSEWRVRHSLVSQMLDSASQAEARVARAGLHRRVCGRALDTNMVAALQDLGSMSHSVYSSMRNIPCLRAEPEGKS